MKTTRCDRARLGVRGGYPLGALAMVCTLVAGLGYGASAHAEQGVTARTIRIGGVLDLEGRSRGLGLGMRAGIEAALRGEKIAGRELEYVALNDSYTPSMTAEATRRLVDQGVFVMMGNVGTPTAAVSLPILAENRVPAVGFFTGAGLLRPGAGDIINFRASYVQETAAVIRGALDAGVRPSEICAFVQNDAYGMAGVTGIRRALLDQPNTRTIVQKLDEILAMEGDDPPRNNVGPVGVYTRNTFTSREGYESLKNWEKTSGSRCRLVVSVGTYNAVGRFIGYARYKNESWVVSAVSFTGADDLRQVLNEFNVDQGVIVTQVVPALDSDLPIVKDARRALGEGFGYTSLEGYIVGKMFLAIMNGTNGELSRDAFLRAVRGKRFDLGGLPLDFVDDNQGSDLVLLTHYRNGSYQVLQPQDWRALLQ